jgi:hypothetical protein
MRDAEMFEKTEVERRIRETVDFVAVNVRSGRETQAATATELRLFTSL